MTRSLSIALFALCALLPKTQQAQDTSVLPGDVLVMLRPDVDPQVLAIDLSSINGQPTELHLVKEVSAPMRIWLYHFGNSNFAQPEMLRAIGRHPGVQLVQSNHQLKLRNTPNDPQYGSQWQHQNAGDHDIDSELAWDITTGGLTATGDTIVVAVMENADLPHADLIGNAWYNFNETPNNGIDDDANGYVDDFRGWNPGGNNDVVYGGSHGTEVAGMIGAKGDNGVGVAGANWNVKIMPVTYGNLTDADVVESYTYPLVMRRLYNQTSGAKGAFVVATNASWGIDGGDPNNFPLWCAIYDSLGTEGVLNCGATANNAVDVDVVGDMPTACGSDFMISVTATDNNDMRTFSAYGATTIDVGAPGSNIFTTAIGGGYTNTSGTSFASPLTAGVIALLYSAPCASLMNLVHSDPEAGALYVRQQLFDGVDQVGNLPGNTVTGGRINANNSLQLIMNGCGACPQAYNLNAQNQGLGAVNLTWSANSGNSFTLHYRPVGTVNWTTNSGLLAPNWTATGLTDCTEYEFEVDVACDTTSSGFSAPFTWTSEGCCTAPTALYLGYIGANSGNVMWMPVLASTAYDVQISVAGANVWTTTNGITNTFFEFTGLTPCTDYDVHVRTDCGGTPTDWSPSITLHTIGCGACQDNVYCPSVSADASAEWIQRVQLNTLDNTSGTDDGYGDHTDLTTDLVIGDSYPITLTPGFAGFTFAEYFKVWIDLDQNGSFDDVNELVYDAGATTQAAITGTLVVPGTAQPGHTRLRVIMEYNAAPGSACSDAYDYGETEDYCVTLNMFENVGESSSTTAAHVFPDPADRDVFFDISGVQGVRDVRVALIDGTGRVVMERSADHGRATLTTAWLNDGLYFYSITGDGRELLRGKLVVAH